MGHEDDSAYRRSVRNTSVLLAAVAIVVTAGLVLPACFGPGGGVLPTSTLAYNPDGLTLNLSLNATTALATSRVDVTVWINGTSRIENVTARDSWVLDQSRLWQRSCTSGWPLGIGVMRGNYGLDNYSLGTLLALKQPYEDCPAYVSAPQYFLVEPEGSRAIASINGSLVTWDLQTSLLLGSLSFVQSQQGGGTFTVVGADEWGDIAVLHFAVPLNV